MPYTVKRTELNDCYILQTQAYHDERGSFTEAFNQKSFEEATNCECVFVQDNFVISHKNVLRGLHFQIDKPQGKFVWVAKGAIFDVAVDLRSQSPTFGKWTAVELTSTNGKCFWIPPRFAHGYLTLDNDTHVFYKTTQYRSVAGERSLIWNDPQVNIKWPKTEQLHMKEQDLVAKNFHDLKVF